MSFLGAIRSDIRKLLAAYAGEVKTPVLVVGAGNFTVPSVLRSAGFKGDISACDVTLYSSLLGTYLSESNIKISISKDCPDFLRPLIKKFQGILEVDAPKVDLPDDFI